VRPDVRTPARVDSAHIGRSVVRPPSTSLKLLFHN